MGVFFLLGLGWTDFVRSSVVEAFQREHLLVLTGRVGQRGFVRWSWIYLADYESGEWCKILDGRVCLGQ